MPFGRVDREQRERARGRLLDRHAEAAHLARQLRLRLHVAHLREDLVGVRVGADLEVHVQGAVAGVGVHRVHVDRVVDAAHLLLDRRGDRGLGGERVRADVGRRELDRRRRDLGELSDRQLHERHDAEHRHQDRDHDRDDRSAYEELRHSSVLRVLSGRRRGDVGESMAFATTVMPGRIFWKPSTTMRSPAASAALDHLLRARLRTELHGADLDLFLRAHDRDLLLALQVHDRALGHDQRALQDRGLARARARTGRRAAGCRGWRSAPSP